VDARLILAWHELGINPVLGWYYLRSIPLWYWYKSISTNTPYVNLPKYFSQPSFSYKLLSNPAHKTEIETANR
jgi:hypothetical protein